MYQDEIASRLIKLRTDKGVSARDMSLSIGQNAGYINTIENGKALPSMSVFFYICEYLEISPRDFFDVETKYPQKLRELIDALSELDADEINSIALIVRHLSKK